MIAALIAFELRRRLKLLSTWIYAGVLGASGFFLMLATGGVFESVSVASGNERVLANSPHALFGNTALLALLGLFTVAAVFGQAAHQDFAHGTWMIVFTTRVKKSSYLIGRFLGAFVFAAVLFTAIGAGQLFASLFVFVLKPTQLGPTRVSAYLWPYLLQVWPMLFFTGAVFFALAALTRRMAPVYVGVVVLVLGYLLGTTLLQDVQNQTLAAMLDPFGFLSFEVVARYWTPVERNRDLAPVWSLLGANRALWCAVGLAVLGATLRWFRTTVEEHRGRGPVDEKLVHSAPIPSVLPAPTPAGWLRTAAAFAWMFFREITRSPVYWTFALCGLVFVILMVTLSKAIFGTPTLLVTYQALDLAQGAFGLFMLITVTFYAGELVWRDRDVAVQDIVDATRAPTWVCFLARLGALLLVALSFELLVGLAAVVSQISQGCFHIEWRLYAMELLVLDLLQTALICVLALFVQTLLNHKYLGHFAMVGYYVLQPILRYLGVEDRLLRYGSDPGAPYSDMNGYGHFLWPLLWYRITWWGFGTLLIVAAYLLQVRGREATWRARRGQMAARFTGPWRAATALGLLAWLGAGAFCFYNTHMLNSFATAKDTERMQAEYERRYKPFEKLPQPRIIGADMRFDIFPSERRLIAAGTYRLHNRHAEPVHRVLLSIADDAVVRRLTVAGAERPAVDSEVAQGVYVFNLPQPLAPGGEADLVFELEFAPRGFRHQGDRIDIVGNGTFFNNFNLPMIGYREEVELAEDGDRRRYGFEPKPGMAPRDDAEQLQHNYIRQDSDFISFQATVSTEPGQIAVVPGTLEKEWTENGRPHWRYAMDQPILNFFSVLSARYAIRRDEWNGVKLEIYHHPTHVWNLDRMMSGMKDALAYCSENFGPYQHHQARILEFPRYQSFAQSFPNTIPYSEGIGFIARVRDDQPDDVDYPYYVTVHEIAHQWWAHQVVGANVRGATMTSESMAQYAALMVMKRKYGPEHMRRYLKFELDRYLVGRVTEHKQERPLADNENQMYIHYQKGTLAMYALQDFIGEERVNRALKKYVAAVRFKGPPYTTSTELIAHLREETPPEFRYLLEDLFETITLYDNRTESATMKRTPAGGYDVILRVKAQKFRSDEQGNQTELEFEDWMDVGALDDRGAALFVEKRQVRKGASEITFHVDTRPARVGLDPLNKLVDRNSEDNVQTPTEE